MKILKRDEAINLLVQFELEKEKDIADDNFAEFLLEGDGVIKGYRSYTNSELASDCQRCLQFKGVVIVL